MSIVTDEDFVKQWASDNGFHVESGWESCQNPHQGYVVIDNSIKTCTTHGETIELAFSRMASIIKGEDPF